MNREKYYVRNGLKRMKKNGIVSSAVQRSMEIAVHWISINYKVIVVAQALLVLKYVTCNNWFNKKNFQIKQDNWKENNTY